MGSVFGPALKKAPCWGRDLPASCASGTQRPRTACPATLCSFQFPPSTDSLGPGTPHFPHTRSLTAEFSLSSTNIGLEEHLKCDDTHSLESVFPGCFGISGKKKKKSQTQARATAVY